MRAFYLLHQAHRAAFRSADQRLRKTEGVSTAQLVVLLSLLNNDGLAMTKLAERTGQPASSLSELVDRMADKNLLSRSTHENDNRIQLVHLEPAGKAAAERSLPYINKVNELLLSPFDKEERDTIERFLTHVSSIANELA